MIKEQEDKIIKQAQDILERRMAAEKDIKVNLQNIVQYGAYYQGARVMAYVGLAGGDERVTMSPRMKCELEHLQELYHIKGGETPDMDFVALIQQYTKELKDYTDTHNGKWSPWLYDLIETRYGFKPYDL